MQSHLNFRWAHMSEGTFSDVSAHMDSLAFWDIYVHICPQDTRAAFGIASYFRTVCSGSQLLLALGTGFRAKRSDHYVALFTWWNLFYFASNTDTGVMPSTTAASPDNSTATDGQVSFEITTAANDSTHLSTLLADFSSTSRSEPNLDITGN